jgi:fumarylacetoacetate (FAA) hydrolase
MKLATLRTARADGRLLLVSRDLSYAAQVGTDIPTMFDALERWSEVHRSRRQASRAAHASPTARCPLRQRVTAADAT